MAKLAFSKLGLKVNNQVINIHYNEQIIEVKQYISVNDKLKLISEVLNKSYDEHNFANPVKMEVFTKIGIIEYYTNITFTDKQKEDIVKLYDLLQSNDLLNKIITAIPKDEYNELINGVKISADAIYTYRNSAMGILESLNANYGNLDIDLEKIKNTISNTEDLDLLRDIMSKLG